MSYRLLAATVLACLPGFTLADPSPLAEPPSMRFEWVREGPADVCGNQCREWIAATGPITSDTARDFEFFTTVRDARGATIVFDSGGGSVLASLELGRKLREFRMTVSVGRTIKLETPGTDPQRAKLSPRGECASMCVFVLLGGVQRTVPSEARILVHQIWPGGKRYDASAETYTAEEMVRIQRDVGRIARYTVDMGGDIELFELAMRIPPWERLRTLTAAELRRMRLQTLDAVAQAPTSGDVIPARPSARHAATRMPERGWTVVETARVHTMLRNHPLTIEGEEVGQFELSLACGGEAGGYKVAYRETRAVGDVDDSVARLKDVTLWLAGERTILTVESSVVNSGDSAMQTLAAGEVTAAFVEKLRNDSTATMVVGTKTVDDVRTSIRVGVTGFVQSFPKLAADCKRTAQTSAELSR
jgi:hypothetical protein